MSLAPKHSMDIPHVTAVELPLIVKNEHRAIAMLGGKERISKVITSKYPLRDIESTRDDVKAADSKESANGPSGPSGIGTSGTAGASTLPKGRTKRNRATPSIPSINPSNTENILELRLRNDPFHHPIQSSFNGTEKILVKVSIPKETLPADFHRDPTKYSVRELIAHNTAQQGPAYRAKPVAIINSTYLFKAMADFQVLTKRNATVQDFKAHVLEGEGNFAHLEGYFAGHENFQAVSDYQASENYENRDHGLPPPPLFLPVQFPFDYKYQKNPLTATMRDETSGEIRVVSKKLTIKLHTIIVDFHSNAVPDQPAQELIDYYARLTDAAAKPVSAYSIEYSLVKCIEWLRAMFEKKPVWTRKHLEDVVPKDLRRVIKQALPYVSYIYKSGPWRFCNVKFGTNPKEDSLYWRYQSEYFRIPGLRFNNQLSADESKIVPPTLKTERNGDVVMMLADARASSVEVSLNLFFDGINLPRTITYQVGDLIDEDIQKYVKASQREMQGAFFREKPDFQDGWINRQTIECIRRIIRYKLSRLVREEEIDREKIRKIMATDYNKGDEEEVEEEEEEEVNEEEEEEADEDDEAHVEEEADGLDEAVTEELLMKKLRSVDDGVAHELRGLVGFVKQDMLE